MEVQALRIIYMFKQYNMWRREKIEEILLRRKIRSISKKTTYSDICLGLTRYTDISL